MLIGFVLLEMKREGPPVQFYRTDFGAQAECRLQDQKAFAAARTLDFEGHFVRGAVKSGLDCDIACSKTMRCERRPIGRQRGPERDGSGKPIRFEAQQSAQNWAYHHGSGPDLVRRTRRKALVVAARKDLGNVAGRTIERQKRVCAKRLQPRMRLMVSIFADRRPPAEERPHRTKVVATGTIQRRMVGDD